jgi:hypothetical protein
MFNRVHVLANLTKNQGSFLYQLARDSPDSDSVTWLFIHWLFGSNQFGQTRIAKKSFLSAEEQV